MALDDEPDARGSEYESIEEPPARPGGRAMTTGQAKLIGAVKQLGAKARAVLVVVDYDGDDVSYKIEECGPDLEEWHDILGVLASGIAYAQSEMFAEGGGGVTDLRALLDELEAAGIIESANDLEEKIRARGSV